MQQPNKTTSEITDTYNIEKNQQKTSTTNQHNPLEDDMLKHVIPIGVSGSALAAGYLGLLSILLIPAPFALIFGILGLREIKKNPSKMGKVRSAIGIIFGGLFTSIIVIWVIAGIISILK